MQQAARVSQRTAYFHLGSLIRVGSTDKIFTTPQHKIDRILHHRKDSANFEKKLCF